MIGEHFMKKSLQLTLILSALLFIFSCSSDVLAPEDPSLELTGTWQVTSIKAYDDVTCSETSIYSYTASEGVINAPSAVECGDIVYFAKQTGGGDATFETNDDFCLEEENLDIVEEDLDISKFKQVL